MKNFFTILLLLLFTSLSHSQSFFIKVGKNFTKYKFESIENSTQSSLFKLSSDTGTNYELGVVLPLGQGEDRPFSYETSFSVSELNSVVMSPVEAVTYKTEYLGLDNSILYAFYTTDHVELQAKLGVGIHHVIFAKQQIKNIIYDVKNFPEFKGLFLKQILGVQAKINASKEVYFTVGYNYLFNFYSYRAKTPKQVLFINSSQVNLGVYIDL